ncbi:MAG: hypothetical protein Q8M76_13180, partial [Spirochaetaceae bacterium]|nr:hypothetical protein [Spirochaetaceae bacterium]
MSAEYGIRPSSRPLISPLALALALAFASANVPVLPAQEDFPAKTEDFSARFEPDDPRSGEVVSLFIVAGERLARYLDSPRVEVDEGLELVGRSSRPRVLASGERGAELELELKVLFPGARKVAIDLGSAGVLVRLGPYSFVAEDSTRARSEEIERTTWRWSAPRSVLRLQAFRLALIPAEGLEPEEAEAIFAAPPGLSLEPTGDLEWVGIALEEGDLLLPAATIRAGAGDGASAGHSGMADASSGKAAAEIVRVSPLPAELAESRAMGDFTLSLEGPYPSRPSALSAFRILVVVRGSGNHPAMEPPAPEFYLDGERLGDASVSARRLDESRPEGGTYVGRTTLELELAAPRAGTLEARWAPFAVLSPSGLRSIDLPTLRVRIVAESAGTAFARGAGANGASLGGVDPFGDAAATAAAVVAALAPARAAAPGGELAALADLVAAGNADRAVDLLESSGASRGNLADEVDYLRAALAWRSGEKGLALSIVYGFLRDPRGGAVSLRRAQAAA